MTTKTSTPAGFCAPGIEVVADVPARRAVLDLSVAPGETVAVVGPNGAGKSTLLSVIAGLLTPDAGRVQIGDQLWFDSASGINTATHRRDVGYLTQQSLLFPHLSVERNIAFGPLSRGFGRAEGRRIARAWMERLDLSEFASRKPHQLSGGQAQRVAVARALASNPQVMLLDEPMAALDVTVSSAMRRVFADQLAHRTTVLVTHDILDVVALADKMVVLSDGKVIEAGEVSNILTSPRSDFAARLAHLNLVDGVTGVDDTLATPDFSISGETEGVGPGEPAVALFSPADVAIYLTEPDSSIRNQWPVTVTDVVGMPNCVRVVGKVGSTQLTSEISAASAAKLGICPGREVIFGVKYFAVKIYPRHR